MYGFVSIMIDVCLYLQSLVDGEQQSYSTFEERAEKKSEEPGTPTMVDSDDEADGGLDTKPKQKSKKRADIKRSAVVSMFVYIMKQSYVLTLIAMMVSNLFLEIYVAGDLY